VSDMTVQTNLQGNLAGRPAGARRRTERMVMLRSATPGVQLVTLRHSVPLRLGALTTEDLKNLAATPKVDDAERVLETTAGKGGDAR
jgi:hypothetical protein